MAASIRMWRLVLHDFALIVSVPSLLLCSRSGAKKFGDGMGVESQERPTSRSKPMWVEEKRGEGSGEMTQQHYADWL